MSDYKARELGQEAERILASDVYQTAFTDYRARIFELIEQAKDEKTTWELKRHLSVLNVVRGHMERYMKEGKIAGMNIETDEKRSLLRRVIG